MRKDVILVLAEDLRIAKMLFLQILESNLGYCKIDKSRLILQYPEHDIYFRSQSNIPALISIRYDYLFFYAHDLDRDAFEFAYQHLRGDRVPVEFAVQELEKNF